MSETHVAAAEPAAPTPPPPQPNGHDTSAPAGGDKSYTVTDTRSAGDAIAGLLFNDGDDKAPPPAPDKDTDGSPSEPEADEKPPIREDDRDKTEQQAEKAAAIEPPRSWSADDKAAFQQLPPALQQTVVRRESQREAALTRSSQEAAETRRAFEGERQAAVALRTEYLTGLQKMLHLAAPEAAQLANVDWVAVQAQSPAEYTRLHALREQMRSRLGAIEAEFQQGQAQLQAHVAQQQAQQLADHVAREHVSLNEKMPDFGDETKGAQLRKDLSTYLRDTGGFSPDEISKAYDHRLVVLATKAMLYDRQLTNAAAADAKRNNAPAQVRRPGTSQDGDQAGPQARIKAAVNRLGRTNSARDAGSLIAELLP